MLTRTFYMHKKGGGLKALADMFNENIVFFGRLPLYLLHQAMRRNIVETGVKFKELKVGRRG